MELLNYQIRDEVNAQNKDASGISNKDKKHFFFNLWVLPTCEATHSLNVPSLCAQSTLAQTDQKYCPYQLHQSIY